MREVVCVCVCVETVLRHNLVFLYCLNSLAADTMPKTQGSLATPLSDAALSTQPPEHSIILTSPPPHFDAVLLSHPTTCPHNTHRDPMDHEKRMLEGR